MHAIVAQSTCRSQNANSTVVSEQFWKFKHSKVHTAYHGFGVKRVSKSKLLKLTDRVGSLWDVEMSKKYEKCT